MTARRIARLKRVTAAVVATAAAAIVAELMLRLVDGYALTSVSLVARHAPASAPDRPDGKWLDVRQATPYVDAMPIAAGVDRSWFALDPAPRPSLPIDPDLERRYWANRGNEMAPVNEWNARYLSVAVCHPNAAAVRDASNALLRLRELFAYEPPNRSAYPTYRFLRNTHYPSGLVTNGFGWRGPDVPINKPAGRVRIAFVGASTTIDAHGDRFSYPEYIGRWLDAWAEKRPDAVTFDVVNAGREGITSRSIAAIVESELVPVRPDLVVYYEGANEFWPNAFVASPLLRAARALGRGMWFDRYSAIGARVRSAINAQRGGAELYKPPMPVAWPADLDETSPPLGDARLPLQLPEILANLERMRAALEPIGATLMPSSFVWHVYPGMVLERERDAVLYDYLNEGYWPFSYAHLRRFADFQNRVFAAYAAAKALPFVDLAAVYPRDPRLFVDAIHMTAAGVKLKAWLVFQQLVPEIERRLQDGRLPVPDAGGRTSHPAFDGPPRRVQIDEVRRRCAEAAS